MRDTRTSLEKQLGAELREYAEGECLHFEQIWALARRGQRARDYHRALRHIATCTACRRAYLELRAIQHMQAQGLLTRVWQFWGQRLAWVPAVGVAVTVVTLAWWLWTPRNAQIAQQPPIVVSPESPTTLVAPEPKGTPTTPRLADETPRTAKPSTDTPARNTTPIERELASIRRVEPFIREAANAFAALTALDGTRADNQSVQVPPIRILKPDIERNPAIEETYPLIQWQPLQQAVGYRLQLLDANNSRMLLETTLDATRNEYRMPPEAQLARGGNYELIITALREGEEPIVLRRRFRVLSEPQRSMWNWAQQHERTHPLLSATVYYYHLDRYTDALRCLRRAQQQNPNDAEINRWLAFVEQRIRQRESEFSR